MKKIGCVILAAGESSRFGRQKQLLSFQGQSLVWRIVDTASAAGCLPIAVVVGSNHQNIRRELETLPVLLVENENWQAGIGTSIRAGVQALTAQGPRLEAIVLLVCDQPFVKTETIKKLITLFDTSQKPIVASRYADTLGVPALFNLFCFTELLALPDNQGAKAIIHSNLVRVAELPFPEGAIDIDNPADYEKLIAQAESVSMLNDAT
jgi:molybdenum cofactor cytidylyltransferase